VNVVELHANVKGFVQGIGFREKIRRIATKFSLTGYVRNLENGDVEFVIQGEKIRSKNFFNPYKMILEGPELMTFLLNGKNLNKHFQSSKSVFFNRSSKIFVSRLIWWGESLC
jgi:acylphosphatase